MQEIKINIVSFSAFDHSLLDSLVSGISAEFGVETHYEEGHLDLSDYLDPSRGQYKANELLRHVEYVYTKQDNKTLGLFNVDLFIPILTFIYGQAYLGGRTAIASSHRLRNSRYGLKDDPILLSKRLLKEVTHELGHTFGLIHCHNPGCVMNSSTYVEEIDQKESGFCKECRKKMISDFH